MEWKNWPTNPRYEVSNTGQVRSKDMVIREKNTGKTYVKHGKILSTYKDRKGYLHVQAGHSNEKVHRMVAQTFIPNEDPSLQVDHKDGNKENNCVENLEWVTVQENLKRAYKNGLISIEGLHHYNKSKRRPVECIKDGVVIHRYKSLKEAGIALFGEGSNSSSSVKRACDTGGKCKGYNWRYVEE